jgi:hypothetical protein
MLVCSLNLKYSKSGCEYYITVQAMYSSEMRSMRFFLYKLPYCRPQWPRSLRTGLQLLGCWDRGFDSRLRHESLSSSVHVLASCVGTGLPNSQTVAQAVLPTAERTVSKAAIRWWPRFSKNCRAMGKEGKMTLAEVK